MKVEQGGVTNILAKACQSSIGSNRFAFGMSSSVPIGTSNLSLRKLASQDGLLDLTVPY